MTETIPALQELKQQGIVRAIGITGLPLDIYPYILDRRGIPLAPARLSMATYTLRGRFTKCCY